MPSVVLHVVEYTFSRGFESYLRSQFLSVGYEDPRAASVPFTPVVGRRKCSATAPFLDCPPQLRYSGILVADELSANPVPSLRWTRFLLPTTRWGGRWSRRGVRATRRSFIPQAEVN